ncbi:MAG: hypothetical protein QOJ64_2345 [Acidobacteriota bacterium]|jgi:cytochrome c-type biogenesis protein CcmH/NrfG|nr:hypothetical protein [Acidobacteriota bacterium]
MEAFTQAVRLDPRHVDANLKLGLEYVFLGKKAEALQQYEVLKNLDREVAEELRQMIR